MEEEDALAAPWRGAVAPVQPRDAVPRRRQRLVIARQGGRRRIEPVGENREPKIAVRIRQIVHLEPLDLLLDVPDVGQQHRHDDHGSQIGRHAVAQLEPG